MVDSIMPQPHSRFTQHTQHAQRTGSMASTVAWSSGRRLLGRSVKWSVPKQPRRALAAAAEGEAGSGAAGASSSSSSTTTATSREARRQKWMKEKVAAGEASAAGAASAKVRVVEVVGSRWKACEREGSKGRREGTFTVSAHG